ncbi:MAG: hypothetical protein EXR69_01955 [Myxococcales bacterium]|nr:hypothetical protein [Myxococcales bacterium]
MRRTELLSAPLLPRLATAGLLLGVVPLSGCSPMDGEITGGSYASYFAVNSSENLYRLRSKLVDFSQQSTLDKYKFESIDCRPMYSEASDDCTDLVTDRLAGTDYAAECGTGSLRTCDAHGNITDDGDFVPFQRSYFPWLTQYSYYVRSEKLDPWRIEAVITTEGDLQLTVHNNLSNVGDFRFGWVVDPHFQPTECVDKEGGGAEDVPVDGDWLTEWSVNEDGGSLFHLNAYGYQLNPSNTDTAWYFPDTWMAGYTFGRMADEDLYGHQIDYLDPISDTDDTNDCDYDNYDCGGNGYNPPLYINQSNPGDNTSYGYYNGHWGNANTYPKFLENVTSSLAYSADNPNDLERMGKVTAEEFPLDLKIEDNTWRPENQVEDDPSDGFGGWIGVDPSWVHFDDSPSDLGGREPGKQEKPLKGHFHVYLESASAASKVLVQGDFTIDHIAKDIWGYSPTLEDRKLEENATPTCGDAPLTADES